MELIHKLYGYKHISFDLWLTLIKSHSEYKVKRNLLFKEFFSIDKSIEDVAAVIRKFDLLTNTINEKVTRNFDTFEIYYLILDGLDCPIDKYTRQHMEEFYLITEKLLMQNKPVLLDNGLPDLIRKLHQEGITMNILSNTAFIKGSSLRKVLAHYGLDKYFAFQAYSDETGFSKPGAEMYRYAYDKISAIHNIEKNQVLHVGDNVVSDYDGAIAFGFDAHLITHKTNNESKLQPA
jgi:putative hydrolase of the HAD superfamily